MSTTTQSTETVGFVNRWIKQLRVHQWVKNGLVFVPLVAGHLIDDLAAIRLALLAFIAFSALASAVYIWNDLLDREIDRTHPQKRERPIAAGTISSATAVAVSIGLATVSLIVAMIIGRDFAFMLVIYFLATNLYSFYLKQKIFADVITLAMLYTLRIAAGAVAIGQSTSVWILTFSMFIFLSLALIKRYAELNNHEYVLSGRGYVPDDLPLIMSAGIASGFIAVLVAALYIDSTTVVILYQAPQILWAAIPLLFYWIARIWGVTIRGNMHDDPVLFASRDRVSLLIFVLIGIVVTLATVL